MLSVFEAGCADPAVFNEQTFYQVAGTAVARLQVIILFRDTDIVKLSAIPAAEMRMRFNNRIKTVKGTARAYTYQHSLLLKDIQIPVYRTEAQGREFVFQLIVDPVCGRVRIRRA